MRKKLKLTINYQIESESGMGSNWEMDTILQNVLKPFGWEEIGRGSGFGSRDLEYEYNPSLKTIPLK